MNSIRLDHTYFDNEVRPHLGALLLKMKLLTPERLDQALELQRGSGKRLGQFLVDLGWLYEQDIARVVAVQNGLQYIDLEASSVDRRAAILMKPDVGKAMCAIPVRFETDGLLIAVADPEDAPVVELIAETRSRVKRCVSEPTMIQTAWHRLCRGEQP